MPNPFQFAWTRAKRQPIQALLTLLTVCLSAVAVNTALSVSSQVSTSSDDPDRFKVVAGYTDGNNSSTYGLFKPKDLPALSKLADAAQTLDLQGWAAGDLLEYGGKRYKQGQAISTGPHYAELSGLKMLQGSFLSGKPGEAVVSQDFARALFGSKNALGQSFRNLSSYEGGPSAVLRVVGVMQPPQTDSNAAHLIVPIKDEAYGNSSVLWVKAKPGQGVAARAQVLAAVRQTYKGKGQAQNRDDQGAPRLLVKGMSESEFSSSYVDPIPRLFALFAAAMLVIGAVGLFSLQLSENSERAHEVGLRRAMGASSRGIVLERLLEAGTLVLFGGLLGSALSAALLPLMHSITGTSLFRNGLNFTPLTALSTVLLLLGVAALSSLYPAWQAARVRPSELLREA